MPFEIVASAIPYQGNCDERYIFSMCIRKLQADGRRVLPYLSKAAWKPLSNVSLALLSIEWLIVH